MGTEEFFERWGAANCSWRALFKSSELAAGLCKLGTTILRVAAAGDEDVWRSRWPDAEQSEEGQGVHICRLQTEDGQGCGMPFASHTYTPEWSSHTCTRRPARCQAQPPLLN